MASSRTDRRAFLRLGGMAVGAAVFPRVATGQARLAPIEGFITVSITAAAPLVGVEKGFFKAEGIDLALREVPSGTPALQTRKARPGNILLTGEPPRLA